MERIIRNKRILLIWSVVVIVIIGGLGVYGYFKVLKSDLFYRGTFIERHDISSMTKEEALEFIRDKKEAEIAKKSMKLINEDKEYDIDLSELGFFYRYEDAIDKLYSLGRKGNIFKRFMDIAGIRKNGVNIDLKSDYDDKAMDGVIDSLAEEINIEPKDAGIKLSGGSIQITEEMEGENINKEKLAKLIADNLDELKPIEIPMEKVKPKKTKELLSRINGVIGEFSTSLGKSSADRIENIRISSRAISNKGAIMPGETVSFNGTTGPRVKRSGYREANVIIAGEFTPDVGGGVCQTSTTLYNALLLADLTIVERSPHSIPSTYVSFGRDAAVAYGHLDLKFKNDFDYPVYIDSGVVGNRVYFRIYGDKKSRDYTVRIDSQVVETIGAKVKNISDKGLAKGRREVVQEGRTGYRANTYKSIIKNGKTVSKKLISKDYYKPREFIYRIGTRPTPSPSKPKEDNKKDDKDKGKPKEPEETEKPKEPEDPDANGGDD